MRHVNTLEVESLGKLYRIGDRLPQRDDLRDTLVHAAGWPLRLWQRWRTHSSQVPADRRRHVWALRNVNFSASCGEVVGIIGDNGAGKSTLLKILSRITAPTEGRAIIRGRVGSLLEVGTGFHPELSGRENVFLNGAILGMRKAEIRAKFDEIVAFAGVEPFLDTPVKRYSTGMAVRLAFAVAAHLEPEILIVDEVLAVGDAAFQKKCLGKMSSVAHEGRTILFVSHKMSAVQSLCQRVLWLQNGEVAADGYPGDVIAQYLATLESPASEHLWPDRGQAPGNEVVRLRRAWVRPAAEAEIHETTSAGPPWLTTRTPIELGFEFWNLRPGAHLDLGLSLYGKEGSVVFYSLPLREPNWHGKALPAGLFCSRCYLPGDLLNDGRHSVQLSVTEGHRIIYRHDDLLVFDVNDDGTTRTAWHGDWAGAVRPLLPWSTELLAEDPPAGA